MSITDRFSLTDPARLMKQIESHIDTTIFDTNSRLDPTRRRRQIEVYLAGAVFDEFSALDPKREQDQIEVAFSEAIDTGDASISITGGVYVGQTLTAAFGDNDPDGAASSVTYQWMANSEPIEGEVGTTLALIEEMISDNISVRVNYTDAKGFAEQIDSEQTNGVALHGGAFDGDIIITSDEEYAPYALNAITSISGSLNVSGTTVEEFNWQSLVTVGGDCIVETSQFEEVNLVALETVGGFLTISGSTITSLNLDSLREVFDGTIIGVSQQPSLSLPAFEVAHGELDLSGLLATSVSIPLITSIGEDPLAFQHKLKITGCPNIVAFELPLLVGCAGFQLSSNAAMEDYSFPALEDISGVVGIASGALQPSLQSFSIPSLKRVVLGVAFTSGSMPEASVDAILVKLASLDGTNGTTSYNNRTITITGLNAHPGAAGLTAKTTLQSRGCTVNTN